MHLDALDRAQSRCARLLKDARYAHEHVERVRAKLLEERVGETRLLVGREGRFVLLSRVSPAETAVDGFEGQRLGLEESLVVLRAVERDSSDVEAMQVGRAEDLQLEVARIVVAQL